MIGSKQKYVLAYLVCATLFASQARGQGADMTTPPPPNSGQPPPPGPSAASKKSPKEKVAQKKEPAREKSLKQKAYAKKIDRANGQGGG